MTDPGSGRDEATDDAPSVDVALQAGAALFNEGHWLAAHEPWEAAWLPLDRDAVGTEADDERLLHGLILVAAATHHARTGNDSGAVGCAEGALGYLDGLGERHRELALDPIRRWCRRIAETAGPPGSPDSSDSLDPPAFRIDGTPVRFADLDLDATLTAAPALAEVLETADSATMTAAADLAREERDTGRTRITELLIGFLREPDARPQIAVRIGDHVERAERKRRDVDDLF